MANLNNKLAEGAVCIYIYKFITIYHMISPLNPRKSLDFGVIPLNQTCQCFNPKKKKSHDISHEIPIFNALNMAYVDLSGCLSSIIPNHQRLLMTELAMRRLSERSAEFWWFLVDFWWISSQTKMGDFGGVFGWISPMKLGDLEYLFGGFYLRKLWLSMI